MANILIQIYSGRYLCQAESDNQDSTVRAQAAVDAVKLIDKIGEECNPVITTDQSQAHDWSFLETVASL